MEKVIENGIHKDISIEDYHSNRSHISATGLKIAKRSLKEFNWFRTGKIEHDDKTHFSAGNAFELALFDKIAFENKVAIMQTEQWRAEALMDKPTLKAPKMSAYYKQCEENFAFANKGKYLIPDVGEDSFEMVENMLESCYKDEMIQRLIKNTEYQLSLFWDEPKTGLKLKTRPDICQVKKNVVVNLKTCIDGSPAAFSKDLAKYDYPLQAVIEIMGCMETGLMPHVDNYFWLVVEKRPPYNATIYEFDPSDIAAGMDEMEYLFTKVKKAMDENLFPGYSDRSDNKYGILTAQLPAWYKMAWS